MTNTLLAVAAEHSDGAHILCTLVLIGAVVGTILSLLSVFGLAGNLVARAGGIAAPIVVTVVLWVVYFVACSG